MKQEKKKWIGAAVTLAVALAIALAVSVWRGFAWENALALNCRYLSDGFFVSGMLLAGLGALIWISPTGFFAMMSYGVHSLTVLFSTLKKPGMSVKITTSRMLMMMTTSAVVPHLKYGLSR